MPLQRSQLLSVHDNRLIGRPKGAGLGGRAPRGLLPCRAGDASGGDGDDGQGHEHHPPHATPACGYHGLPPTFTTPAGQAAAPRRLTITTSGDGTVPAGCSTHTGAGTGSQSRRA